MTARSATPADADAIARIYNEGIQDRMATFETRFRSAEDVRAWLDGVHPVVVVQDSDGVVAFAATFAYRPRACYAGIAETSVYVSRPYRRRGRRQDRAPGFASGGQGSWFLETAVADLSGKWPRAWAWSASLDFARWEFTKSMASWTVNGATWRLWNG